MGRKVEARLRFATFHIALLAFLAASIGVSSAEPLGEILSVAGKAIVVNKLSGKTLRTKAGMEITQGDTIQTFSGSSVEILFANESVMKLGGGTRLKVDKLHETATGIWNATFVLYTGKIVGFYKNRPSTISRYEVHTDQAVAGLTGTLPIAVTIVPSPNSKMVKTEVDLLKKEGSRGLAIVKGTDLANTQVILKPGMRTIALKGSAPMKPYLIDPGRVTRLEKTVPVKTAPRKKRLPKSPLIKKAAAKGPSPIVAAQHTFGAEVMDVSGKAFIVFKEGGKTLPAARGMRLSQGDMIKTDDKGSVEILYEDGNLTRIDENTELLISKLKIGDDKSRISVLRLVRGRIKNSVTKIFKGRVSFTVHTKTAIAGVTGTPPWVVTFIPAKGKIQGARTEVDLLGKRGDTGSVLLKGVGKHAGMVVLNAGQRTIVPQGMAPLKPFSIRPQRLKKLQKSLPLTTPPAKQLEKKKEMKKKIEEITEAKQEEGVKTEEAKSEETAPEGTTPEETAETATDESESTEQAATQTAEEISTDQEPSAAQETVSSSDLMMEHITRNVSVGEVVSPTTSTIGEETETQIIQGETATSGTSSQTLPNNTTVDITINIDRK